MTVRISATDWVEGGIDADDAVAIARAFADARRRRDRRLHRPGRRRTSGPPTGARTRRRSPTGSATDGRTSPIDRGRGDLVVRRRQLAPARRAGRPRARSGGPTSTTRTGPCTPPLTRSTPAGVRLAGAVRRRPAQAPDRADRRAEAAARADPRPVGRPDQAPAMETSGDLMTLLCRPRPGSLDRPSRGHRPHRTAVVQDAGPGAARTVRSDRPIRAAGDQPLRRPRAWVVLEQPRQPVSTPARTSMRRSTG